MKSNNSSRLFKLTALLLILSGSCLILFSVTSSLKEFIHYKNQEIFYIHLTCNTSIIKTPPHRFASLITTSCPNLIGTLPPRKDSTPQERFIPLLKINPEIIGWITITDTPINYPMVQHNDNQYYLNHDSSNSSSIYGSIYIDHRNQSTLNNKNTLIYGHNMNNGSMFHTLVNYKDENFFKNHPYIYISNLYETFTYEVFSVYVVDANTETISVDYKNPTDFLNYLSKCKSRSLFVKDIALTAEDQIVTLVTCSYELDNARTIVQAKRIEV